MLASTRECRQTTCAGAALGPPQGLPAVAAGAVDMALRITQEVPRAMGRVVAAEATVVQRSVAGTAALARQPEAGAAVAVRATLIR